MNTSNFTTSIVVDNSAEEVFNAINNVRGWWSEEVVGNTDTLNEEWAYHYQDAHKCKMRIIELIPNKRVVWLVLDNYFSFTEDKSEWIGNTIIFEITEKENKSHLQFTQVGLVPEYECFDICQNAWNTYIQKSLYSLIVTGTGQPNGKDKPQTEDEKSLTKTNYTTTFFVDQSPHEVFTSIINVRGWWQGEIQGSSNHLHDEFSYQMNDIHYSKQRVVEFIPDEKLVWLITESNLNFIDHKNEWDDTSLVFEIKSINNKTQLRFTHIGLLPTIECYNVCSNAWEQLIQVSLHSLITTGKGKDIFE